VTNLSPVRVGANGSITAVEPHSAQSVQSADTKQTFRVTYDVGFNPSTQRHYRMLIYYLYIHSYMFRSYDHHHAEKYITTLGLLD
jgi:hypothetical protein